MGERYFAGDQDGAAGGQVEERGKGVDNQTERLADYILSLARTCGLADPVTVVVGGGLVREPNAPVFAALRRTCERRKLNLDLQHTQYAALVGALLDAIAEGGGAPTEVVRSRLSEATR